VCAYAGRHTVVPYAISAFAAQSYRNRVLLIYDDSGLGHKFKNLPERVVVRVFDKPFQNLGVKRMAMLRDAASMGAEYVVHWDDDDLVGPDYLRDGVSFMSANTGAMVSAPGICGWCHGNGWDKIDKVEVIEAHRIGRPLDGQIIFRARWGLKRGYDPVQSGQCIPLLGRDRAAIVYRPPLGGLDLFIGRFGNIWHTSGPAIRKHQWSGTDSVTIFPANNYEECLEALREKSFTRG
jgi:hypothetical protein